MTGDSWHAILAELEAELRQRPRVFASRQSKAWLEAFSRIRRLSAQLLGSRHVNNEDVDDIAQDVMFKLQSADILARLRRLHAPEGYLVASIRNAAVDLERRRNRERQSLARLGAVFVDVAERASETLIDARLARLGEELRALAPADAQLLRMRFWRNLQIGDIAARLGVPYSTVAVRLFRLLARLRGRLEQSSYDK